MEARSAGVPRGWGLGRGAVAPPQYGGLGAGLMPLHVANQLHQSPSRPCVTERNDVFGTVCSEESDLVTQ